MPKLLKSRSSALIQFMASHFQLKDFYQLESSLLQIYNLSIGLSTGLARIALLTEPSKCKPGLRPTLRK